MKKILGIVALAIVLIPSLTFADVQQPVVVHHSHYNTLLRLGIFNPVTTVSTITVGTTLENK